MRYNILSNVEMGYEYYMNDPRFWRGVIDVLDASWEATKKRFAKYNKLNEDILEEKKTKKMTKAEAFEYLKGKKVLCYSTKMEAVQGFVKSLGFHWSNYSEEPMLVSILFLGEDGKLTYSVSLKRFEEHESPEVSADDILSIEIIEEKYELEFNYDKVVELAKPLMHYLNEVGCPDGIRVSQLGIIHEPMSTLIFDNGIGE